MTCEKFSNNFSWQDVTSTVRLFMLAVFKAFKQKGVSKESEINVKTSLL